MLSNTNTQANHLIIIEFQNKWLVLGMLIHAFIIYIAYVLIQPELQATTYLCY